MVFADDGPGGGRLESETVSVDGLRLADVDPPHPARMSSATPGTRSQRLREDDGKERRLIAKTKKDIAHEHADSIRPYVERAMSDDSLRRDVVRAFAIARDLYGELARDRDKPITIASRVATDDEIRDKLRDAIEDLRSASGRLQGKKQRTGGRASTLLITGIALGILFNPVTGPESGGSSRTCSRAATDTEVTTTRTATTAGSGSFSLTPGMNGPAQRRRVEPVARSRCRSSRSAPPRAPGR